MILEWGVPCLKRVAQMKRDPPQKLFPNNATTQATSKSKSEFKRALEHCRSPHYIKYYTFTRFSLSGIQGSEI